MGSHTIVTISRKILPKKQIHYVTLSKKSLNINSANSVCKFYKCSFVNDVRPKSQEKSEESS